MKQMNLMWRNIQSKTMCGELKLEGISKKIGAVFPIEGETGNFQGQWLNHTRSETIDKWLSNGWKEGKLSVSSYTEGHNPAVEFNLNEGESIKIIYRIDKGDPIPFNIVTKEASKENKHIHSRFPVVIRNKQN